MLINSILDMAKRSEDRLPLDFRMKAMTCLTTDLNTALVPNSYMLKRRRLSLRRVGNILTADGTADLMATPTVGWQVLGI